MYTILADFFRIKSYVLRFIDKCSIVDDRKHYTKAVHLFQNTLYETSLKLEDIYYEHVLRPQIGIEHTKIRNETVDVASLIVLLFITRIHQAIPTVASLDHYDQAQDT